MPESEQRSYRLDVFNEKLQQFLDDHFTYKVSKNIDLMKKWQSNVKTDPNYLAPHIKVMPGVIRPTVITVGDPFRCEVVAKMCEKYEQL